MKDSTNLLISFNIDSFSGVISRVPVPYPAAVHCADLVNATPMGLLILQANHRTKTTAKQKELEASTFSYKHSLSSRFYTSTIQPTVYIFNNLTFLQCNETAKHNYIKLTCIEEVSNISLP